MRAGGSRLYLLNPLLNLRQRCQVCVSDNAVGIRLLDVFSRPLAGRGEAGSGRQAVQSRPGCCRSPAPLPRCSGVSEARTDPASPSRRCFATLVGSLVKRSFTLHGPTGSPLFFPPGSSRNFRAMRCSYFFSILHLNLMKSKEGTHTWLQRSGC